jgi:hypothetical protein
VNGKRKRQNSKDGRKAKEELESHGSGKKKTEECKEEV